MLPDWSRSTYFLVWAAVVITIALGVLLFGDERIWSGFQAMWRHWTGAA